MAREIAKEPKIRRGKNSSSNFCADVAGCWDETNGRKRMPVKKAARMVILA